MQLRAVVILFISILLGNTIQAQIVKDTLLSDPTEFHLKQIIIPTSLITIGVIGLESHTLKDISESINNERDEHIDDKFTIDDFSQYSPIAAVYALNAFGVQGKRNFGDRTLVIATAHLIMTSSVHIIKTTSNLQRPDGSAFNSFPSGHTATAFMGAEFLWQEYKHQSVWYGISGYAVATLTGAFRMYNDRHWFNDVVTGAGIGIISTKIAYWLLPTFQSIFKKKNTKNFNNEVSNFKPIVLPCIGNDFVGIGLSATF
ncbi:phosphatase PAP2 family protein [Subsaxibacter sp. CAU 1640]|uniref:phosphatase PAP2 family protein n=1 Tax=Subsaxibacter sp. CAU 1640 TaxID=2933271 RepID=UPI00200339A1|nr:phosphatase PAP2 family protein [Subsaxibacter sp. CAU 1640]MCK7590922.1 phosphatase PAP2 family protein [Subsaxibacter sp. CAU 1640]